MPRLATAALLALAASPAAAWNHLSEAGFQQEIKNKERTLVAFVEPSLEACQQLDVEWASVAGPGTSVASVDCTADSTLCGALDVASYPAIRLFYQDGRVQRYRGRREAPEINAFLRRASRPFLTHVDDKNATSFLTADDVVFVARYGADDDGNLPDRFAELARTYWDQYAFAVQAEGGPASAAASASVLTCHRPHGQLERSAAALAGAATALEAFVAACSQPLVVDLTRRNELQQMGRGKSLVHFLYRTADERRAYAQRVQGLAQTYGEYLVFTTVDVREFGEAMVASLGLADRARDAARPLLAVQNPSNGQVFPFTGRDKTLTAPVVERFLGDIIRGAVRPWQAGSAHDEL